VNLPEESRKGLEVETFREAVARHWGEQDELRAELTKQGLEVLREAREKNLGVRAIAKRVGVSPTYISQVKRGKVAISPAVYLRICEELDKVPN
jgi:hypothetical protein